MDLESTTAELEFRLAQKDQEIERLLTLLTLRTAETAAMKEVIGELSVQLALLRSVNYEVVAQLQRLGFIGAMSDSGRLPVS